jgi:hypothetical protein
MGDLGITRAGANSPDRVIACNKRLPVHWERKVSKEVDQ